MLLKKSIIFSGIQWSAVSTISLALIQLVKISVLARFLNPEDFGLMAIVVFILNFINLFVNLGISAAIMHKKDISDQEYSSLFWANISFSIIFTLVLFFASPVIANFYSEIELKNLIPIMALNIIIIASGRQFYAIEQKNMHFKFISLVEILSAFFSLGLAVILAIQGYGVYALVYSLLLQNLISNFIFLIKGGRSLLMLRFRLNEILPFLKIGGFQVGGQIINYFSRDLDILVIGKTFGPELLGGYSLAKQLVARPTQITNPILNKVGTPVLAKIYHEKLDISKYYFKLLNLISTLNFVVFFLIFLFASELVTILYGNEYISIIIYVKIFAFYFYFRSIISPIGSLVVATGKTELEFKWNVYTVLILTTIILTFSQVSLFSLTISLAVITGLFIVIVYFVIINPLLNCKLKLYLKSLVPNPKEFKNLVKMIKVQHES